MEWLTDNGSCYTATEIVAQVYALGMIPCFTPIRSPQPISNRLAYTTVQPALLANQAVFMMINLLGIWRWLLQPTLRSPRADRA